MNKYITSDADDKAQYSGQTHLNLWYKLEDALEDYQVAGRVVPYASGQDDSRSYSPAASWLRANPHRLHLGQIGLRIARTDGSSASIDDLSDIFCR